MFGLSSFEKISSNKIIGSLFVFFWIMFASAFFKIEKVFFKTSFPLLSSNPTFSNAILGRSILKRDIDKINLTIKSLKWKILIRKNYQADIHL